VPKRTGGLARLSLQPVTGARPTDAEVLLRWQALGDEFPTGAGYRHDKTGNSYVVAGVALDHETHEPRVSYERVPGPGPVWDCTAASFRRRFSPITNVRRLTANEVIIATANVTGQPLHHLMHGRDKDVLLARQVAMYVTRVRIRSSYPVIGKAFQRDHTTIIHGINRIRTRLDAKDNKAQWLVAQVQLAVDQWLALPALPPPALPPP